MRNAATLIAWLIMFALVGAANADTVNKGDDHRDPTPEGVGHPTSASNAHFNESLTAADGLRRARELASRSEWAPAARLLDELIHDHGDTLMRGESGLYLSAGECIRREMLSWPAAGREVYAEVVGHAAEEALAAGRRDKDLSRLLRDFLRYFVSPQGAALGDAAAEFALEAGEFATAQRVYQLLGSEHPQRDQRGEVWNGREAIAEALAGDAVAVDAYLAKGEITLVRWLGQDRPVSTVINDIRQSYQPEVAQDSAEWPVFGGNLQRNGQSPLRLGRFAELWEYAEHAEPAGGPLGRSTVEAAFSSDDEDRHALAGQAVYADSLLVYQDAFRVRAVRAAAGSRAWTFASLPASGSHGVHDDDDVAPWYAPTVARGRVYAALGGHFAPYFGVDAAQHTAIVCLSAVDGNEIWRHQAQVGDSPYALIEYDGSPLVRAERVIAIERRRRSFGFEECRLIALDARDGGLLWQTHLGSASVGGFGERRPTMSLAAVADDTVYVATNLSAVAAVDAHTGQVRWLRAYAGLTTPQVDSRLTWRHQPMIVDGRRLVCFPHDLDAVLVLDRETGEIEQELPKSMLGEVEYVAGIADEMLYAVGREIVAFDLVRREVRWTAALASEDHLNGRGLLTQDAVLVPTERFLCAFDRVGGRRSDVAWETGKRSGNLLGLSDRLIVVGGGKITVYADTEYVWSELKARLADQPTSIGAALDLAELALRTGRIPQAREALGEAVRRTELESAAETSEYQRRIFDAHMELAEALRIAPDAREQALAVQSYSVARRWAPDAPARLRCRLPLAELLAATEPRRALDVYQEVLADPATRRLPSGMAPASPSAQRWCALRIGELLARHGRKLYAEHEQRAVELMTAARTAKDSAALDRVADEFPNALAARASLIALGDVHAEHGKWRAARQAYIRAIDSTGQEASTQASAELHAQIARCAAQEGRGDVAASWLARGQARWPNERVAHAGGTLSWEQLRASYVPSGALPETAAPTWAGPPTTQPVVHVAAADGPQVLSAILPGTADSSFAQFHVYTDDGIRAYFPGQSTGAWNEPTGCARVPTLLAASAARAVFATGFEVFAVDMKSGARIWTAGAEPAGVDATQSDPEDFPRQRYFAVDSGRIIAVRPDKEAVCLDGQTGAVRWTYPLQHAPSGRMLLERDRLIYPTTDGLGAAACICDANSGRTLRLLPSPEGQPISRVLLTDDDRVLLVSAGGITAYEAEDGERVWSYASGQRLSSDGVAVDLDGVYVSPDGYSLVKLALWDGSPLWQTPAERIEPADHLALAVRGEQVWLGSEAEAAVFDVRDGNRLARWRLEADERVDRWEFLNSRLVAARFIDASTVGIRVFDPRQPDRAAAPLQRYTMPIGRAESIDICDHGLILGGGGAVVSFAASPAQP